MIHPFFFGHWILKNTTNKQSQIIGHQSLIDAVPYARKINTLALINKIKINFKYKKGLQNLTNLPVFHKQYTQVYSVKNV
jgi:hypothetical protein